MSSLKISDNASVRPKIRSKHSEKLMGEPLEKRTIRFEDRDGIERYYPALHIKFSHTMVFIKYLRPPLKAIADLRLNGHDIQNNDLINKWMTNTIAFQEMIKTLLRLQHNQFWSTLIYERSLQISLESYLRSAPRDHDMNNFLLTDQMKDCIKRIHILIFKLYLRICTFAESKTNFISENTFGALIYDNYLIDVPKIIELCVLYSNTNYRHLLSQILSNIIQCQPRYEEDLAKGCANICDAIVLLQQKVGSDENQFERINKLSNFQWSDLQSMVSHITDISVSLEALIQTIPQTAQLFKNNSIDKTIIEFYNRVFPSLQNEFTIRLNSIKNNDLIVEQNQRQIMIARSLLLITFRHIIEECFINKLMDKNLKIESKMRLIDELVETLTLASFEKSFIIDYHMKYPVEKDFEELSKHSEVTQFESFDKTRIDYLKSVIQSSLTVELKIPNPVVSKEVNESDIQLESSVQYLQEIMPELGPGFIQKCLIYYDGDNEKVLNAILENNLPPHLETLDRSLQKSDNIEINHKINNEIEKPKLQNGTDVCPKQLPEVIDTRDNIYNNDEFDLFRNKNIDLTRIHSGKRDKQQTQPKIDNKFKEKIMDLHHKRLEEEENRPDRYVLEPWTQNSLNYDDEYDDTYEDDTQIDLINDKLMDELDTKSDPKEDNNKTNDNNYEKEMTKSYDSNRFRSNNRRHKQNYR